MSDYIDKILMSSKDLKKRQAGRDMLEYMSQGDHKKLPSGENLFRPGPAPSVTKSVIPTGHPTPPADPASDSYAEHFNTDQFSGKSDKNIEGGDVEAAIMQQYAKAGKVPPLEKVVAKKVLDKGKKSSKPTNWKGISQGVAAGLIGAAESAAEEKEAAAERNRTIMGNQMASKEAESRARGKALSGLQQAFATLIGQR